VTVLPFPTRPPVADPVARRAPLRSWRHVDPVLVVCSGAVAVLGVVMVFSATRGTGPEPDLTYVRKQGVFVLLGVGVMAVTAAVDHRRLRPWARWIYAGSCAALVLVLSPLGHSAKGAQAWFSLGPVEVQPSEVSKLALIVGLAALLGLWRGRINAGRLALALAAAAIPMALIMRQPDLGTALVYVAIVGAMLVVGGARGVHLLVLALAGVVLVTGVLRSDVLKDYQKNRLAVFLDPGRDHTAEGYNLNQSMTAVSRGGLTGDGLFQGRQTQLQFVPEQQTDFIFTVVAEELGFVGSATFLALTGAILWRVWRTAALARDAFGRLVCVGVLAMLAFQVFESVGMATGIMPVTGIPLPLMSYGGSTTLATFAALGLVLGVHLRRTPMNRP
jgi:rod shape determining protein RodA